MGNITSSDYINNKFYQIRNKNHHFLFSGPLTDQGLPHSNSTWIFNTLFLSVVVSNSGFPTRDYFEQISNYISCVNIFLLFIPTLNF